MESKESRKFKQKITQIGGSLGLTIPSITLQLNRIEKGDIVIFDILEVIKNEGDDNHE